MQKRTPPTPWSLADAVAKLNQAQDGIDAAGRALTIAQTLIGEALLLIGGAPPDRDPERHAYTDPDDE
jgi:hypothetical protein